MFRTAFLLSAVLLTSGCIPKMAASVVTAPIKVASKTVDVMTTSQKEADRNRGREMRKEEERREKEERRRQKEERERWD